MNFAEVITSFSNDNITALFPSAPESNENCENKIFLKLDVINDNDLSIWEGECYFVCGICRRWFATTSSLTIHFSSHFNDCPKCDICGSTFTTAEDYADHCAQHVGHTCLICDETFFDLKVFKAHVREHKLNCLKCNKKFSSEEELKLHSSKHDGMINLQCDICLNNFSCKRSLKLHKATHKVLNETFECELCNAIFTSARIRKRHYKFVHRTVKKYVCHICGKQYSIKNSLDVHLLNHTGEKPYACLVCGHQFADKRNFKRHGVHHMPDITFKNPCKICGKVFNNQTQLRSHEWAHTHKGHYKCVICPRTFDYSSHLKRHMLWHNGEQPFSCTECKKGFIQKSDLNRHLANVHKFGQQKVNEILAEIRKNQKTL